jgi:hypothetical protein
MSSAASTAVAAFVRPRVILGTMPFGQQVAEEGAEVILRQFAARHTGETRPNWELDTGTGTYHDWRAGYVKWSFRIQISGRIRESVNPA